MASAPEPERELVDRILAIVDDHVITLSEVEAAAQPFLGHNPGDDKRRALYRDVLDQLIADQLLAEQIRESKLTVSDEELDNAVKEVRSQYGLTEQQLEDAIRGQGMSMSQYREDILKKQLLRLKIVDIKVRQRVFVSDADIRAEYERQAAAAKAEMLVKLRHMLFRWGDSPDPGARKRVFEAASAASSRVRSGEPFEKVAREVSDGPTAESGGDLGEMSLPGLLPEIAKVARTLAEGTISPLIETPNGIHVVRVEGRRFSGAQAFPEVKDKIQQELHKKEFERQRDVWIDELRAASVIDIRL